MSRILRLYTASADPWKAPYPAKSGIVNLKYSTRATWILNLPCVSDRFDQMAGMDLTLPG